METLEIDPIIVAIVIICVFLFFYCFFSFILSPLFKKAKKLNFRMGVRHEKRT